MPAPVDVAAFWQDLEPTFAALQQANRLPSTALLYDPSIDVVKTDLRQLYVDRALDEAKRVSKRNNAAAYVAYELIKAVCLSEGWVYRDRAAEASKRSAEQLDKVQKQLRKQAQHGG